MSNYLIFSDLHLNKSNLESAKRVLRQIFEYARQHKCIILFLGDFFHAKGKVEGKIHFEPLIDNFNIFNNFVDVEVWMIPGNHDFITSDKLSIDLFKKFENVKIIREPVEIRLSNRYYGYFVPHCPTGEQFLEAVKKSKHKQLCFAHVGVMGAQHYGFYPQEDVSVEAFKGWKYVFLGHYHTPQKITANVEFVGSVLQSSWVDACVNTIKLRRFIHLQLEKKIKIKRVQIEEPVFLVCDSDKIPESIPEGSKIRINVVDSEFNQEEAKKKLSEMSKVDFFRKEVQVVEERSKMHVSMSPSEVIKTHLKETDLKGLDPEELWEVIAKLLHEDKS